MKGARKWPVVGHYPSFYHDTAGFLARIAREQGDIARFTLGSRNAVLCSHPDMVRAVLVEHATAFRKGNLLRRARRLLGHGLLTSEGEFHKSQRRSIQPVFSRNLVAGYAEIVAPTTDRMVQGWRDGAAVRIDAAMHSLTMSVVVRALLGADIESEAPAIGAALHRLATWAPVLVAPGGQLLERTRIPILRRFRDAIELVDGVITRKIAEGGDDAPLLAALASPGPNGEAMPAQLLHDEVMTIFLAGHDTTSAALTWTWILLAEHPDVLSQVEAEVDADEGRFPYTEAVLREVVRLYPPIGRIGRRAIGAVELGEMTLAPDDAVFLSPYVTQRDDRWFENAAAFRPDRWTDSAPAPRPYAYFPFGAGSRSCIGEHFARAIMLQVVTTVVRSWHLRSTRSRLPRLRSLLTLKPRGPTCMVAQRR